MGTGMNHNAHASETRKIIQLHFTNKKKQPSEKATRNWPIKQQAYDSTFVGTVYEWTHPATSVLKRFLSLIPYPSIQAEQKRQIITFPQVPWLLRVEYIIQIRERMFGINHPTNDQGIIAGVLQLTPLQHTNSCKSKVKTAQSFPPSSPPRAWFHQEFDGVQYTGVYLGIHRRKQALRQCRTFTRKV